MSTEMETIVRDWDNLPLILTREQMCRLLLCSDRTLTRKLHSGRVCRPLNHGDGNNRWLRDSVRRWFEDGCPPESGRNGR